MLLLSLIMERSLINIMIRLTEIKRRCNIVSAVVTTVEANSISFEIVVDIKNKKLVKNTHEKIDTLVGKAMGRLIQLDKKYGGKKLPKETVCVWY